MAQQDDGKPAAADETDSLQFQTATFDEPRPAPTCAGCGRPIAETYYAAGEALVCPGCREQVLAALAGGSRVARLARALAFGVLAAVVAGLIWWGIRKATGYEIGLIAIVVGLMVGGAVRHGARGRGGIGYQLLAVALTYSCIVSTYIPDVYAAIREEHRKERAAAAAATAAAPAATQPAGATEAEAPPRGPAERLLLGALFLLILFIIAAVAPVLAGFENIIGLLIIAFALWEAWRMNRRTKFELAGPFFIEPTADAAMAPLSSGAAAPDEPRTP